MERKYIKCKECDNFHWSDAKCDPIFEIEFEDEMGEWTRKIHAYDFEEAAEKFAEKYNEENEYYLMDNEIKIKVIDSYGIEKNFIIGAEQSVNYWSKEI